MELKGVTNRRLVVFAFIGARFLWFAEPGQAQAPPAPYLQIQLSGSQQLLLDLSGSGGRIYRIDTSSNLVDWSALLTTNSVISNVTLTRSVTAVLTSEYYRAVDLGPVSGGAPSAVFTLIWPGSSGSSIAKPLVTTPAGSVVFVVTGANGQTATNTSGQAVGPQVVNLSSDANQVTVPFSNLRNGDYTVVADAYPQPDEVGVPFEEARFAFTVTTGGPPVTQTFTLAAPAITGLLLTPLNPTVAVGGTVQLNATALDASNEVVFVASQSGALTWSSEGTGVDASFVTVDFTGKVTGVAPGSYIVQVAETSNPTITTNVTVTSSPQITTLTITPPSQVSLAVGEATNLTVTATDANGNPVPLATSALTWTYSGTNVVMDGAGILIGVSPGVAGISVSAGPYVPSEPFITAFVNLSGNSAGSGGGAPPPAHGYMITDLGPPPAGGVSSGPIAINDKGHIAGSYWDWDSTDIGNLPSTVLPHAFIWKTSLNGQMEDLGDLGGGQAEAFDMNLSDQIVGISLKAVTTGSQYAHAFSWKSGKMTDLNNYLGIDPPKEMSFAYGINDQGQIAGYLIHPPDTNPPPFYAEGFVFIKNSQETNVTQLSLTQIPRAINNAGLAGGSDLQEPFLWQNGQTMSLTNLPGSLSGYISRINNLGQAVGSSGPVGFPGFENGYAALWQNGNVTNPDTTGNFSAAYGINDLGTVVGFVWTNSGGEYTSGHAVLWQSTNAYDLNAYIPTNSGWVLLGAGAINNKGQIVGVGSRTNEVGARSFLLTPNDK